MLTRHGWFFAGLTAALGVGGLWLGYRELVVVAIGMTLCLIAAVVWVALRPELDVSREIVPVRVGEGDGATGSLTVTNSGQRRCPPVTATESFADLRISVQIPSLAPGAIHRTAYRLPTERRGCYAVGPLIIGNADPLRLVTASKSDRNEATLWVHPRIHRVSPIPSGHSEDIEGPTSSGAPRGGIAFHSLRAYEPGDDLRLIHWRSSARSGSLMVRHIVVTNEPRLLIVLDTSSDSYVDGTFEDAVRVAASLVAAGVEKHFPTEFRTTGGTMGRVDPTGVGRNDVLDKLAAAQTDKRDPGLQALVTMAPQRSQGVSVGVVTGQPTPEQARSIGVARGRFEMMTLVQVGERFERPALAISGIFGVNASTSEDFVRRWKIKVP